MAKSANRLWWLPGLFALTTLVLLVALPFATLVLHATPAINSLLQDDYLRSVIKFTFYQAALSTILSVGFAIIVALALSRQPQFRGRRMLLNLFSVSLIIPSIVAIFGIVAVFGRTGWLNQLLQLLGITWQIPLYGLSGILLAHVFFNMPLATRVLLQSLDTVSEENWRLAAQLGMPPSSNFRFIEWPAIRARLAGISVLVFSLCFTSFAIVLTLGGGPRATTIEVAIYQALRFDFDLATAVSLSLIQLIICAGLLIATSLLGEQADYTRAQAHPVKRFQYSKGVLKIIEYLVIGIALGFVVLPLLALFVSAINPAFFKVLLSASTLRATLNTLLVALASGTFATMLGLALLWSTRHLRTRTRFKTLGKLLELPGFIILVVPPVVLGTGLFLMLRPYADVFALALLLAILVNALMSLPFVLRILESPFLQTAVRYDRLCLSLGIGGLQRLKLIEWPQLRNPLGLAMAVATTLAAGDLTVIALFGSEQVRTLSLLLYQRMGSYRLYEAAVTAALLLVICLSLFWAMEKLIGKKHVDS